MKIFTLIAINIFLFVLSYGQTNFKWEKTDSVLKTKTQIYSDTKMYIAKTWKSSEDVIQNDDKEAGAILIKGVSVMKVRFMNGDYEYKYGYSVTFKMKENKYKIILDNVYFESAYLTGAKSACTKIEPFDGDNCPATGTFSAPGLPKKKVIPMMASLKEELQSIIDNYEIYIKSPSSLNEDW